jgi:SET domain
MSGKGEGRRQQQQRMADSDGLDTTVSGKQQQQDQQQKKKKKRKKLSPFRIRMGSLVAFRYLSKGNHVMLEEQHQPFDDNEDDENGDDSAAPPRRQVYYGDFSKEGGFDSVVVDDEQSPSRQRKPQQQLPDPVTKAHFCEVWTDPQHGRDDGLALIGSRVRVVYSKAALAQLYPDSASTSSSPRMIEGEVVSIVDYERHYARQRDAWRRRESCPTLVELLIDNRENKNCTLMPFLKRTDEVLTESDLRCMKESERRSYMNELRIKGGPSRAVVRVLLCDINTVATSSIARSHPSKLPEGRWVVRKRVAAKVVRDASDPGAMKKKTQQSKSMNDGNDTIDEYARKNERDVGDEKTGNGDGVDGQKKKRRRTNKDFQASRYLGDGNDTDKQQEANWRWQVGRYFNPYVAALGSERPISMELLERLSYNFVGEVVGIHQTTAATSSSTKTPAGTPLTLAMVSVQLLALPEHTRAGRMPGHGLFDAFHCDDLCQHAVFGCEKLAINDDTSNGQHSTTAKMLLRIPVEELLVVCRDVRRQNTNKNDTDNVISVRHSYSFHDDRFTPQNDQTKLFKPTSEQTMVEKRSCRALSDEVINSISKLRSTLEDLGDYTKREGFIATRFVTKGISRVNFAFVESMESFTYESSSKAMTKIPTKTPRKLKRNGKAGSHVTSGASRKMNAGKSPRAGKKSPKSKTENTATPTSYLPPPPKDESFRPTSSRLIPYNVKKRKFNVSASELFQWRLYRPASTEFPEKTRNLRSKGSSHAAVSDEGPSGGKKLTGRAARAKQRRVQRSVAAMGVVVDTLGGRETQLRFDRSGIHDWGVFVDTDVKKGEMIVEYRGELIGNAMAEKREKEYEDAKIGSDYMFRIDELTVCDATKQGNVARFINASCEPNCYTKIITMDNTKRIVIYAKKDIPAGTELCYDYKFSLEYDPGQRIPCSCGADSCRGYLNWDKRLLDTTPPASGDEDGNAHHVKRIKGAENECQRD